jgi:peptidyl-prolyl cis-trans isomerase C
MFDLFGPKTTPKRWRAAVFAAGLAALAPGAVLGQDTAPAATPAPVTPDTIVATVAGESITEADLAFAAEDLQQELAQMPPAERKPFLLTVLIDMKVMAKAARDAQMDQTDIFKRRLAYLEERALRRAFFAEQIASKVTDAAIQAAYDEMVGEFQPQEEVHARHILVASKQDAEAIRAELEGGAAFDVLAKEKSTDPSAVQNGGDLGFFQRGQMVKPFEDAAFGLEPGQVSDPIESQFGWHVIKVEGKRQSAPPTLDQLRPQLQQQVMFQAFEDSVGTLKQGLEIDIPDEALAAAVAAQAEAATP